MIYKYLLLGLACLPLSLGAQTTSPQERVSYQVDKDFETVKANLETIIVDRGFTLNSTLHISDMLQRTGKDLGFTHPVYAKAETLEFCSAAMAHRLVQAHPDNVINCPFIFTLYSTVAQPKQVTIAFRKPLIVEKSQGLSQEEIENWLRGIIHDALKE